MRYRYVVLSPGGGVERGVLEADSEERAEQLLWQRNLTIISLTKLRPTLTLEQAFPTLFGVKRQDLISFSRELSSLLGSGIPILSALNMLLAETRKPSFRRVLRDIITNLEMGNSFSQALSRHPEVFSPTYVRLIQVGEGIGNLELVLKQLTSYLEREEAVRSRIARSLVYPSFIILVAILAIFILLTIVLPAMMGLLREFEAGAPITTRFLIAASGFLKAHILKIVGALGGTGLAMWLYRRTPRGLRWQERVMFRIPQIGEVSLVSNLSRVARTLNLLLGAGVSIREALDLLVHTTPGVTFRDSIGAIRNDILEGQLLSQAMRQQPLFPPMFSQMVGVGEQTGELPSYLQTLALYYEEALDRAISRLLGLVEPLIILVVGALVGFIAVSVISPLYSLVAQMK